jgi:hypothetical protein
MATPPNDIFVQPGIGQAMTDAPMPSAYSYDEEVKAEEFEPEDLESGVRQRSPEELTKFMELARRRFRLALEVWGPQRELAREDMKFRLGEQWPENVKAQRELDNRPCITINRVPQFIRQVTNDERQNRPSIHITPRSEKADPKTAEILEGLIRSIEYDGADVARDTAFDFAATTGGPGWYRVVSDYEDDTSFNQKLTPKRILDQFSVYSDPWFEEPDGSDMGWLFIITDYTTEDYKAEFPKSKISGLNEFRGIGDDGKNWCTEKTIRVAEYWHVEKKKRTLCRLKDGTDVFESELSEDQKQQVAQRRTVNFRSVEWAMINGVEVLKERLDYKGQYIPVLPVLGEETVVDGKRQLSGIVRNIKDPQRAYNYWTTAQTEMIALGPKAPVLVEAGQLAGVERFWKDMNVRNQAYLPYTGKSIDGSQVPPPQPLSVNPPIQAMTLARAQAADDMKGTVGIYDASLGNQGNETSGRAILARQREGDVANFHLIDNLTRTIKHEGRIYLDLIPYTYDAPRVERIIGTDQTEKLIKLQSSRNPNVSALPDQSQTPEVDRIYDVGVGKYDVAVLVGPSYSTRRQEAAASMVELTRNYPAFAQVAGDIMVRAMDWPMADKIAERLKKTLPPELQDAPDGKQVPIPPQVQQQIQALLQQSEQMSQVINKLVDERESKILELASRERIAAMQVQGNLVMTEAKLQSQEGIEMLRAEIGAIGKRLDTLAKFEAMKGLAPNEDESLGAQPDQTGLSAMSGEEAPSSEPFPTGGQMM